MLSKVAERVYWMARYLERSEDVARLVSVYGDLLLDLPRSTGVGWPVVGAVLGLSSTRRPRQPKLSDRALLRFLLVGADNPASLLSALAAARENARTARDVLPTEAWRAVNELYLFSRKELPRALIQRHRNESLARIVSQVQRITGLLHGTMSHGPAHQFVRIGRYLERADMTTRVAEVAAATLLSGSQELVVYDNTLWMAVLRSLSGYQMYRQYVRRRVQGADVMRFLLKDREFPRAIRYCVKEMAGACDSLPNPEHPRAVATALAAAVENASLAAMTLVEVQSFLDRLQQDLAQLSEAVSDTWFRPAVQRRTPPAKEMSQ